MPTDRDILLSIALVCSLNSSLLPMISPKYLEISLMKIEVSLQAIYTVVLYWNHL